MVTSFSSYTGGEFLSFYIALMVAAIYAGASLPNFFLSDATTSTRVWR